MRRVLARAAKDLTFPVRPPSYIAPSFWTEPLTITRARPLDPGAGWVDFLTVPNKDSHIKIVRSYIATPYLEGQVAFRWLRAQTLYDPDTLNLPANVERHINRIVANPYPARFRTTTFVSYANTEIVLQANNQSVDRQLAFAAVYGWYYPSLRDPFEAGERQGVDDTTRSW